MASTKAPKGHSVTTKISSLFQETNATMFQFLAVYWNQLLNRKGKPPTRTDIINRLPYQGNTYKEQSQHIVNAVFAFQQEDKLPTAQENHEWNPKNDKATLDMEAIKGLAKIPIFPSALELRWLKTFLLAPESHFLLTKDLHDKLDTALAAIQPFDYTHYQHIQLSGDSLNDKQNLKVLRLLCQALQERRQIQINHHDFVPLRLCYDEFCHRYSLIVLKTDTRNFARISLPQLRTLKLTNTSISEQQWQQHLQIYQDFLKKHQVYLRLSIMDKRNARERCYTLFSAFDKTSYIPRDGIYRLKIFFYDFDREDVICRILSLGSAVIVEEDEKETGGESTPSVSSEIRQEVIRRLLQAHKYYFTD